MPRCKKELFKRPCNFVFIGFDKLNNMVHIIISSIFLSIIHAMIPNHWIPLLAIGKAEHWNRRTTLWATAIIGLAHVSSTILLGILVGWIGLELSAKYRGISEWVAPSIIILLGIWYICKNLWHGTRHHHEHAADKVADKNSMFSIVMSMSIGMFFSPCIELESYYFTAGIYGWYGILGISLVYMLVTVSMMVLLVYLGMLGINKFNFHFLEHHEHTLIGGMLILVGIASFFINI